MKWWHCGTELIWGGDHDCDDITPEYDMVTNLSCPNCETFVEVWHKFENSNEKKFENSNEKKTLKTGEVYDDFNYVYYC